MRIFLATALIALSLASPALAQEPSASGGRGFIASIPHDFMTGARFYGGLASGWLSKLLSALGLTERFRLVREGEACHQGSRCAPGLVCLNACDGGDCASYAKRCLKGPQRVDVLGEFSRCGGGDLCGGDTACTRICPAGADCPDGTHRCLAPTRPLGRCSADADCRAACADMNLPPIGPAGWRASCTAGSCACAAETIDPSAPPADCAAGTGGTMACPLGTREACTGTPPRLTCLTAPDAGGSCSDDAECSGVSCGGNATPFCDASDRRCKCRSTSVTTVSCDVPEDCSAASACGQGEIHACIEGSCACAPAGTVSSCAAASDCSADCPPAFVPACVEGSCACQRITQDVPVACTAVEDCAAVACPEGYAKSCIEAACSCSRTR